MMASATHRWLLPAILFGSVYLVVGVWFPNPSVPSATQFLWRLGAWVICAVAFGMHIGLEHGRFRSSPLGTALHASSSVAVGACGLAIAANVHAFNTGTGNPRLLRLALVIWPVVTGVPAFVVAWVAAAGLARVRRNDVRSSA